MQSAPGGGFYRCDKGRALTGCGDHIPVVVPLEILKNGQDVRVRGMSNLI